MTKLHAVLLGLFWFPLVTHGTESNTNEAREDENSLQFHLMKIDLLEEEDRILEWRDTVREASELFPEDEAV